MRRDLHDHDAQGICRAKADENNHGYHHGLKKNDYEDANCGANRFPRPDDSIFLFA